MLYYFTDIRKAYWHVRKLKINIQAPYMLITADCLTQHRRGIKKEIRSDEQCEI